MSDDRVFILGAGRAGRGLARALGASGVAVTGLHGTRESAEPRITAGALPPSIRSATIILVTVRDGQLDRALDQIAKAGVARGAAVLHASGSAEPAGVQALRAADVPSGTFHPLVPFADEDAAAHRLRGAWIGIDGDPPARDAARRLATRLGARVLEIPEGSKIRYHAAAVFAANFPIVLAATADRLLREAGVPADEGWPAVLHLMRSAVANVAAQSPAHALTGPIARGDVETVRAHVAALAGDAEALASYRALSRAALALAREHGTPSDRLREIELALLGELA